MVSDFGANDVLQDTFEVIRKSLWPALIFIAVLTAIYTGLDELKSTAPQTFVGVAAGYAILVAMLQKCGLVAPDGARRFGAYFGLSLLYGLGVIAGLLLFVIPGIILFVRWLPAFAILLSENRGATESLRESWERTKGHAWPLAFVCLIMIAAGVLLAVGTAFVSDAVNQPLVVNLGGNLLATAWVVFYTALGVAAHRLLGAKAAELTEVFA